MIIAFYKVDNSLNYGRHEFDTLCDQPQETLAILQKLPETEVRFYDTDQYSWQSKSLNLADFETDFNNEELDNGWWCVILPLSVPKDEI